MSERGSAGGIAYAKIQRAEALEAYYKNPNICQHCHNIIHVLDNQKVKDVKVKKFCNRSCAAQYYADIQKEETQKKRIVEREEKERQRQEIKKERIFSEDFSPILKKTKGEFFKECKNWQSARSTIQRLARKIYENSDKPKQCQNCGYDKHYQVCHIKSVAELDDHAVIFEVNNIDNLLALCPNCHWEFDHGQLTLDKILKNISPE